jgi:hypothetical protein
VLKRAEEVEVFCKRDLWRAWSPGGLPRSRDADGPLYSAPGTNRPPKHSPSVSVTARAAPGRRLSTGSAPAKSGATNAARYHPSLDPA